MSSSGSDSTCVPEEEDEGKIYQWIYEVHTDDLEETFPYSSGRSPLHPESDTERRTHEADSPKEQDMDLLEDVQEIKKNKRNEQCHEKKPWKKPEANISDYFNYGFNEETWSAYCKKQAKLKTFKRKRAKIMTQKEHAGYGEQVPCCSHSSSSGPSIPASRESNTGMDVRGRKAGCSITEEGHPCLTDGSSDTQVVTEMSHKKDSTTADHLPTSVSIKSLFAFVPPPPFLFQSEHSSSPAAVLVSDHPEGFCGPSTSQYRSSSGSMANSSAVIDTTKAWECYIRQEKHDKDRNRSREHGHDKESKRCRDRGKHSSSSSHNRREEQKKRKRSTEHERKHLSGDKSRRDKSEGRQKTSQSSSSRKNDCKDRDRGRKHKGREKQKRQREQQDELC